jgi:hypothetical protein
MIDVISDLTMDFKYLIRRLARPDSSPLPLTSLRGEGAAPGDQECFLFVRHNCYGGQRTGRPAPLGLAAMGRSEEGGTLSVNFERQQTTTPHPSEGRPDSMVGNALPLGLVQEFKAPTFIPEKSQT